MHARMSGGIGKEGGIVRLLTGCLQDEMHQGLKEHRDTQSTCNAGHQPCPHGPCSVLPFSRPQATRRAGYVNLRVLNASCEGRRIECDRP